MTLLKIGDTLKRSNRSRKTTGIVSIEQLYDEYAPLVYSIISKFIPDKRKAEEALGELFMHLHKHPPNPDEARSTFGVWLINTSRNIALNKLCAMQQFYGCNENFKNLSPGEKTVFALYYFRSYSIEQISEVLHLQGSTCEKLLRAAEAKQTRKF